MLRLDVRALERRGYLQPGMYYSWQWSRDGEPRATIGVSVAQDHVRLIYTRTPYGSDPENLDYPVWIERTPCRYGNSRPWFCCPRCHSRRAVLYGIASDGRFGCRSCMRLGYASEAEDRSGRLWRKMSKLQARLADGELKPKGMRWRTFERICAQMQAVDQAFDAELSMRCAAFFARHGMTPKGALS